MPLLTSRRLTRIGIETGPVVVDAAGEIYGDAPNTVALAPSFVRFSTL
jgi:class 3 adenylate cyclase